MRDVGYCEGRWTPQHKARFAEMVEANIVPPHPRAVTFCSCCAHDLGSSVYAGTAEGIVRWAFLCARCASNWIVVGGSIALRWERPPMSMMEHA